MRYYRISLIALSAEKKGVDAAHRVSLIRSVTISVTKGLSCLQIADNLVLRCYNGLNDINGVAAMLGTLISGGRAPSIQSQYEN